MWFIMHHKYLTQMIVALTSLEEKGSILWSLPLTLSNPTFKWVKKWKETYMFSKDVFRAATVLNTFSLFSFSFLFLFFTGRLLSH